MSDLQSKRKGWVVMTDNYGCSRAPYISDYTFSSTRSEAIKKFTSHGLNTWRWWKRKYKYRCVRAQMTIKIEL